MTSPWILGARPRTLPAAVVPVLVGSGLATHEHNFCWWIAILCLIVALAMQVGVNYANDYSDGIKGTDAKRVGPLRLVGSGLIEAKRVKAAAFASFGVAAAAGLVISLAVNPWLLLVGAACVVAAWFYTGGSKPYGYRGLGELSVFVFFGLVATIGTAYAQTKDITSPMVASACALGLLAVALLVVNNLRDIPGDTEAGKRTIAVRIGDKNTRRLYVVAVIAPYWILIGLTFAHSTVAVALASVPLARKPVQLVIKGAGGRDLIPVLGATSKLQLAFGGLMALGWFL